MSEHSEASEAIWSMTKVLRSTIVSAVIMGTGVILVALAFYPSFSAVGIVLGVVGAWLNMRFLDRSIGKISLEEGESMKALRRRVRGPVLIRLGILTAGVLGLVILYSPVGIGSLVGLVVFQFCFIVNLGRAQLASGGSE
ncbi:MAG: hypothetical protein WCK25_04895 [Actinomycetes bacterium]